MIYEASLASSEGLFSKVGGPLHLIICISTYQASPLKNRLQMNDLIHSI